jgi:hypothetical protein
LCRSKTINACSRSTVDCAGNVLRPGHHYTKADALQATLSVCTVAQDTFQYTPAQQHQTRPADQQGPHRPISTCWRHIQHCKPRKKCHMTCISCALKPCENRTGSTCAPHWGEPTWLAGAFVQHALLQQEAWHTLPHPHSRHHSSAFYRSAKAVSTLLQT